MKYELLAVAVLLLVGNASAQDTVVAVDPDTEVAEGMTAEGEDVVHYWGVSEQTEDEYDGTEAILLDFDDNWEAGDPWDPNEESTREGSDLGGNPDLGQEFLPPVLGDEVVIGPSMEIFQGRDVTESLATELGRGGGARGHPRGRGRRDTRRNRNLRAKKLN